MKRTCALLLTVAIGTVISTTSLTAAEQLTQKTGLVTREMPWDGGEWLLLGVPAKVEYIQSSESPGRVIVTGPARSVNSFTMKAGVLDDDVLRSGENISIVVHAPSIKRFSAKGGDQIIIRSFDQDEIEIHTTGRADIKASGRVGTIKLHMLGVGWADLSQLEAKGAEISVTGARNAIVSATDWAKLSGNGKVILLKRPEKLTSELWGAGRVFITAPEPAELRAAAIRDTVPPLFEPNN